MNQEIKLEYIHLCDFASPAPSGKVNLLGIFDSFLATKAPDFYVVVKIINAEPQKEYKISFEVVSVNDNKRIYVDQNPIQIPSTNTNSTFNILQLIKNLDFLSFGTYKITALVDGNPIGYKQLEVKKS
ncbi:MAG: hypothetical protein WAV15_03910 [Minisyncoccia bacterium]